MHQLIFPAVKNLVDPDGVEPSNAALSEQCLAVRPRVSVAKSVVPDQRLELCCQPYQSCGSPSILTRSETGAGGDNRNLGLRVTNAVLCHLSYTSANLWSLHPASNRDQSNTNRQTCHLIDRGTRAGVLTVRLRPPEGRRRDSNPDFRQLGAVYQTRTGVCRLAVCRPSHWTNTANLWSGVRESNPSNWFGRPAPRRSANPAKTHLSCCETTYYTVSRDGRIRTSVTCFGSR